MLTAATDRVLRRGPESFQYGGSEMVGTFPRAITDPVDRRELVISPEKAFATDGTTQGINAICEAFPEPGRVAFSGEPTFPAR